MVGDVIDRFEKEEFWVGVPVPGFAEDVVADGWGRVRIRSREEEGDATLQFGDDLGDHAVGWSELVDTPDFFADLVGEYGGELPAGGGNVERKGEG